MFTLSNICIRLTDASNPIDFSFDMKDPKLQWLCEGMSNEGNGMLLPHVSTNLKSK
jgi:hypothetical protein